MHIKVALPNFMTFSCSLTTIRYFNDLALLTKNCLKKNAKKIVDLREIYNTKCNFSFCFAKQKGYNNKHILDNASFKSAFLGRARVHSCFEITAIETYVTRHAKMALRTYADSVAQDRPAHPRSLIRELNCPLFFETESY